MQAGRSHLDPNAITEFLEATQKADQFGNINVRMLLPWGS